MRNARRKKRLTYHSISTLVVFCRGKVRESDSTSTPVWSGRLTRDRSFVMHARLVFIAYRSVLLLSHSTTTTTTTATPTTNTTTILLLLLLLLSYY